VREKNEGGGEKRIVSSATCLRIKIPYSGKLSREKLSQILWLFAKVFSTKFGGVAFLAWQKRAICKSFLSENRIFHQFAKVSLDSFPLLIQYN